MTEFAEITSAEEFVRLRSSDVQSEYHRAAHSPASLNVWKDVLARFPDHAFWVAQNKQIPMAILIELSRHPDDRVRSMVASKGKATDEILTSMASDPAESVRMQLARHPKAPPALLERLREDSWDAIRELAERRLRDEL